MSTWIMFYKIVFFIAVTYAFGLVSWVICNWLIFKRRKRKFDIVAYQLAQQNKKNK